MEAPRGAELADGRPIPMRVPNNLYQAPLNGGIEALGSLWDGRLFALTEYWIKGDVVRGWLGGGAGWWDIGYRFTGAYRPSDAGVMPNDDLAVLRSGPTTRAAASPASASRTSRPTT